MTIPLDRLYHFIENLAQEIYGDRVIIYRFWPHGSKNVNDLNRLVDSSWKVYASTPAIWCNDQEPLNHDYYSKNLRSREMTKWDHLWDQLVASVPNIPQEPKNLNWGRNWFEKNLLLHSEKRSTEVEKYRQNNNLIPVYYWNHAILALDWYRYAQHETFQKSIEKTFLIYNRAWSGTREYRNKFLDLLIDNDLVNHCKTSFNKSDPESKKCYNDHDYVNSVWKHKFKLEEFFQPSLASSCSSANFVSEDYASTEIEVVLETLFDDSRLHLTEKSLRPIACQQPFILVSTQGSLEYMRSYGFQTFESVWNESYDQESDPYTRLCKIVDLMREISNWDPDVKKTKMLQAKQIAEYNRKWFFSQQFFDTVVNELRFNLSSAFSELSSCNHYTKWINLWNAVLAQSDMVEILRSREESVQPDFKSVLYLINLAKSKLNPK